VFRKLLSAQDSKELRRGVDALRKRVEKHFGDADDPGLSRELVEKVFSACEQRYLEIYERVEKIREDVYQGDIDHQFWRRDDIMGAFRR